MAKRDTKKRRVKKEMNLKKIVLSSLVIGIAIIVNALVIPKIMQYATENVWTVLSYVIVTTIFLASELILVIYWKEKLFKYPMIMLISFIPGSLLGTYVSYLIPNPAGHWLSSVFGIIGIGCNLGVILYYDEKKSLTKCPHCNIPLQGWSYDPNGWTFCPYCGVKLPTKDNA